MTAGRGLRGVRAQPARFDRDHAIPVRSGRAPRWAGDQIGMPVVLDPDPRTRIDAGLLVLVRRGCREGRRSLSDVHQLAVLAHTFAFGALCLHSEESEHVDPARATTTRARRWRARRACRGVWGSGGAPPASCAYPRGARSAFGNLRQHAPTTKPRGLRTARSVPGKGFEFPRPVSSTSRDLVHRALWSRRPSRGRRLRGLGCARAADAADGFGVASVAVASDGSPTDPRTGAGPRALRGERSRAARWGAALRPTLEPDERHALGLRSASRQCGPATSAILRACPSATGARAALPRSPGVIEAAGLDS